MTNNGCDPLESPIHRRLDGEAGVTVSRPSLVAGIVPGSAEASGGLQKTHHCEKRLPESEIGARLNLEVEFLSKKSIYFEVLKLFFF